MPPCCTAPLTERLPRVLALLGVLLALGLAGCTIPLTLAPLAPAPPTAFPAPAAPPELAAPLDDAPLDVSPTPTPRPWPSDAELRRAVQASLDTLARAYAEGDAERLAEVVDQENLPFRRLVKNQFEATLAAFEGAEFRPRFRVQAISPMPAGFARVTVRTGFGMDADWLFRQADDGRWVLAEPSVEQLGAPLRLETEHFVFITYPWADEFNGVVMALSEREREQVLARLGQAPEAQAEVNLRPIYGLTPFDNPTALATYDRRPRPGQLDRIEVYVPGAYTFGFYDPKVGWEAELTRVLVHEYTHMAHFRAFDRAGLLSDWMVEGLAEYVCCAAEDIALAAQAAKSGRIIPIIDTVSPIYKQDLMHLTRLNRDVGLGYALGGSLVAYVAETQGGLDGFWRLARAYDETQDLPAALQQAFGVSYEEFDRGWRAWLTLPKRTTG